MSALRDYGKSVLRKNSSLRTEIESLSGRHEPIEMTEAELYDLLRDEANFPTVRRQLKAVAKLNRSLERELENAKIAHRQEHARRFAEGKDLNPRLTELFVSRAGDDPEGFWREHGELLLSLNHN